MRAAARTAEIPVVIAAQQDQDVLGVNFLIVDQVSHEISDADRLSPIAGEGEQRDFAWRRTFGALERGAIVRSIRIALDHIRCPLDNPPRAALRHG